MDKKNILVRNYRGHMSSKSPNVMTRTLAKLYIYFLSPHSWSLSFSGVHYSNHGEHPEGRAMFLFLINFTEQRSWWAVTLTGEQDQLESRSIILAQVCNCPFLVKIKCKENGLCFNKNNPKCHGTYSEGTGGFISQWIKKKIEQVYFPSAITFHQPG